MHKNIVRLTFASTYASGFLFVDPSPLLALPLQEKELPAPLLLPGGGGAPKAA